MDLLAHTWEQLAGRLDGPMYFRFLLQPAMAVLLAVRAGMADARTHRAAYLWTVVSDSSSRPQLLRDGFKDVAKVFTLAIVLDVAYQLLVFKWVYPIQTLLIAVVLALLPYALVRGPVTRLLSKR
jgi:hypothetical protein